MSVLAGTRVPYRLTVANGTVDRQAWAALVQAILDADFNGNQSKFASVAKVTPKTVGRWLRQENDVSEQSVRDAARNSGRDPLDWLVKVGYYTQEEASRRNGARLQGSLGQFIIQRMAALGYPNADALADAAGVHVDTVTQLIFDQHFALSPEERAGLARALEVSPDDLLAPEAGGSRGVVTRPPADAQLEELASMLSADSPLTDAERRNLRALVDAGMQLYRDKYAGDSADRRVC